jgi:hypothetical protein
MHVKSRWGGVIVLIRISIRGALSPNLAVVTPQRDGIREQSGGREGNTPVFIAVKRLNNKAQGRRARGAPWGQRQKLRGTPTGSNNNGGQTPRTMSLHVEGSSRAMHMQPRCGWCYRADQDLNTRSPIPNLAVVTPQRDGIREQSGGREGNTPVFIAVKRLNNKAQGRRVRGAPWGQRQKLKGTPTGSNNNGGHTPRTMSLHVEGRALQCM